MECGDASMTTGRTVRVYVSSTFRDMHAERQVLASVVLPELRRRCQPLGVEVLLIDPCAGLSEEEAEADAALGRRLQLVEQCRPYFVGLFGERYGKVPGPP